jgi:hypothetical protein
MPFLKKSKPSDKKTLQHLVSAATSSDPVLASTVSPSTTASLPIDCKKIMYDYYMKKNMNIMGQPLLTLKKDMEEGSVIDNPYDSDQEKFALVFDMFIMDLFLLLNKESFMDESLQSQENNIKNKISNLYIMVQQYPERFKTFINELTESSQSAGMKHTRKVKRIKSKSKSKRTKHRK